MNYSLYHQLEALALEGGYTTQQVSTLTRAQITNLTGFNASVIRDPILGNIRHRLVRRLLARDNEVDKGFILDLLDGESRVEFRNRFPDAILQFKRVRHHRAVIIWLEGPPGEED